MIDFLKQYKYFAIGSVLLIYLLINVNFSGPQNSLNVQMEEE